MWPKFSLLSFTALLAPPISLLKCCELKQKIPIPRFLNSNQDNQRTKTFGRGNNFRRQSGNRFSFSELMKELLRMIDFGKMGKRLASLEILFPQRGIIDDDHCPIRNQLALTETLSRGTQIPTFHDMTESIMSGER